MNNSSFSKIWIIVILLIFIGGGILVYQYWKVPKEETLPAEFPPEETPISEKLLQTIGIFYQYKFLPDRKVVVWTYNFSQGKKEIVFEFDSFYNPDILLKNNKIVYGKVIDDSNCVTGFLGQIQCHNELILVDLSDSKQPVSLAADVPSFAFSPDASKIFYVLFNGSKNQSNLYRYHISSRKHELVLKEWSGLIDLVLGSNIDGETVFFSQGGKLYQVKGGVVDLLHDAKTGKEKEELGDLFTNYDLAEDASKVLIKKETRWGPTEIGIFDFVKGKYQQLDLNLLNFAETGPPKYPSRFTNDAKGLSGVIHEGYGKYSYWIFDLATQTSQKIFGTDKGLIISPTFDKEHFLLLKSKFIDHRGRITFFIEPSFDQNQYQFVIDSDKADGNSPNIYFLGWMKKEK